MKLTKYTHSCVRLERDGNVLVIDPGTFSEVSKALQGAQAVLITHEHADHLDQDAVLQVMGENSGLELYAPQKVADQLRDAAPNAAERIHAAEPDMDFTAAGFAVRTFGGQHALIHPLIPMVANIGYLVDNNVYHPGDAFIVPYGQAAKTLLVPVHAPWSKVGEVIDFVIAVRAERAFPIHDALLNDTGIGMVERHVASLGSRYGTDYQHLNPGESIEV